MVFKVIAIALIGVMAVGALRQVKPELAVFASLAAAALIVIEILGEMTNILDVFGKLGGGGSGGGSSNPIFKTIIKIIGIGYITEYAATICEDYGSKSIAKNVQLAGKVGIFALAVPIVLSLIDAIGLLME